MGPGRKKCSRCEWCDEEEAHAADSDVEEAGEGRDQRKRANDTPDDELEGLESGKVRGRECETLRRKLHP